ncbi:MAG: F0F1 ATP synthase subunit gamma [Candidatus Omnitrophica bacterium]|nr:F0F1 ATP synthase subunit gamma [Candidatus Omnitrophota bacterium]
MATIQKIESELEIMSSMRQIMEVMKGIALSSFVASKNRRSSRFNIFTKSFDGFFQFLDLLGEKNPLIVAESPRIGVIAITSNESFMAGLNGRIIKKAKDVAGDRDAFFMITGPRMKGRLSADGKEYKVFPPFRESNMNDVAAQIKDYALGEIKNKRMGKLIAVFADPVTLSKQEIRAVTLLPARDVYPKELNIGLDPTAKILAESSSGDIAETLVEFWLMHKLLEMFLDNKMSESAAQAMQLDGNLENLMEYEKKLVLQAKKTKREIIDTSLRETVSAMMAAPA